MLPKFPKSLLALLITLCSIAAVQPAAVLGTRSIQPRARHGNLVQHNRIGYCFVTSVFKFAREGFRQVSEFEQLRDGLRDAMGAFVERGFKKTMVMAGRWELEIELDDDSGFHAPKNLVRAAVRELTDRITNQKIPTHMFAVIGDNAAENAQAAAQISVWITDRETNTVYKRDSPPESPDLSGLGFTEACDKRGDTERQYFDLDPQSQPICPLPKPPCSSTPCNGHGVGGFGSNDGECKDGCPCAANEFTPGHCGSQPGNCKDDGCNGQFTSDGFAKCTGAFIGCRCNL